MENNKAKCSGYGMFTGIYWIVGLGIILGVVLGLVFKAGGNWDRSQLVALLATGIALSYIALSLVDWIVQVRALAANPLSDDLELSDRTVAAEQLAALKGCTPLHRHIRRLLAAWAAGASGPQVVAMAGNQMLRTLVILAAETAAMILLLVAGAGFGPPQALMTLGTGFMVLVLLLAVARFQLASHLAGYIESHLLARIGNDTPAAAGVEFAQAVAKTVADSTASLADSQNRFAEQLTKAEADAAAQIAKAQSEAAAQIAKAQQESAAELAKSQDKVTEQLGRVSDIAGSIDNIFKLQQAVDGTLKGVAVTDEFTSTLAEFKKHLAASDELLKNASKPRTIRLVEKDNE